MNHETKLQTRVRESVQDENMKQVYEEMNFS